MKIIFFLSEDKLSGKLENFLNEFISKVKDRISVSSRTVWPGHIITSIKIRLLSELAKYKDLEFEVWKILKIHEREVKKTFDLEELPAIKIEKKIFSGNLSLEIASNLFSMLSSMKDIRFEEVLYSLTHITQTLVKAETVGEVEEKKPITYETFRKTVDEKLRELEKMLREKKIDEETYKKMKSAYEELLKK
ncbi:MAG: hypothetical protein QXD35_05790 [Nitrososphaerota archaeon]